MELKYKFSYGKFNNFFLSQLIIISYHFSISVFLICFIFLIVGSLQHIFQGSKLVSTIIVAFSVCLICLWLIYLITILFIPKKAIIDNNFIKIKRYFLNVGYLLRGFNDDIYIKEIVECKKYNGISYHLYRSGPYAVFFFDWDDLVEIKTKDEKRYLVPLKNSDDFIDEVNKRRCILQEADNSKDDSLS